MTPRTEEPIVLDWLPHGPSGAVGMRNNTPFAYVQMALTHHPDGAYEVISALPAPRGKAFGRQRVKDLRDGKHLAEWRVARWLWEAGLLLDPRGLDRPTLNQIRKSPKKQG
jgi:hypothetical protein